MLTENVLQARILRKLRAAGWLAYKWTSPGHRGVPDLICWAPDGRCVVVEVKTERGRLTPLQQRVIARLQAQGVDARVITHEDQLLCD